MDNFDRKLVDQYLSNFFYDFTYSKMSKERSDEIILYFESNKDIIEKRNKERYKKGYGDKDLAFKIEWVDSSSPIIKPNSYTITDAFFTEYSIDKEKKYKYKVIKIDLEYNDHANFTVEVSGISFSKLLEEGKKCNEFIISNFDNIGSSFSVSDNLILKEVHEQNNVLEDSLKEFFTNKQDEITKLAIENTESNFTRLGEIFNEARKIVFDWFQKYERSIICNYTDDNVFYSIARYLEAGKKEDENL